MARSFAFLLIPAAGWSNQTRGESLRNRRQNLNDTRCQVAAGSVEVAARFLFAVRTETKNLSCAQGDWERSIAELEPRSA